MKKWWAILRWKFTLLLLLTVTVTAWGVVSPTGLIRHKLFTRPDPDALRDPSSMMSFAELNAGTLKLSWPLSNGISDFDNLGIYKPNREGSLRSLLLPWYLRDDDFIDLRLPLWMPVAAVAIPTFLLWRSHLRTRRAAHTNLCPTCNYALAGLPAGAACPECGGRPEA